MTVIAAMVAGVLAGSVHALAGPDHVAALAPFAIRSRWRAWWSGARWAVGHTASVALMALLAWWFREALPLEIISAWSEQIVGFVLVAIGLWTLRTALRNRAHMHVHEHDGSKHAHMHVHGSNAAHDTASAHEHSHAPMWVGFLHGLAGSSHFIGVLPALAFPSRAEAAVYLTGYGTGTMAAMICVAALIGMVAGRLPARGSFSYSSFLAVAGCVAIGVGGFWLTR